MGCAEWHFSVFSWWLIELQEKGDGSVKRAGDACLMMAGGVMGS